MKLARLKLARLKLNEVQSPAGQLRIFGGFDGSLQAGFLSCRYVLVDYIFRRSLVQFFSGQARFGFGSRDVTSGGSRQDFFDLGLHRRFNRLVYFGAGFCLAKSFSGTGGIWHNSKIELKVFRFF